MEIKKTITSVFMVPTLKIGAEALHSNGFINGYINDKKADIHYDDCIYLLFKPTNIDKFREFLLDEYERTKAVIDDYNHEGGFVVIVYQLDPAFEKDFNLIKLGKYSKTSLEFQSLFPKIVKITTSNDLRRDEISIQYRVFNKTQELKEYWEKKLGVVFKANQELWHGFIMEEEILDSETIKDVKTLK